MALRPALHQMHAAELDDLVPRFGEIARSALLIGICFYAALALLHLTVQPAPLRGALFAIAAATALFLGAYRGALQSGLLPRGAAHWVMFTVTFCVWLNSALHLWLSGEPMQTTNIAMAVIIAGIVLLRRSQFLSIVILSVGSVAIALWLHGAAAIWIHYAVHLVEAIIIAGTTFIWKRMALLRNQELREKEQRARNDAEHNLQRMRETEAALAAARDAAETANVAKSRFLATMSHELRTPLNAILGFSEMIAKETYGPTGAPQYTEYARIIHESGTHLLSLIGDVLDLSKIEAGKLELRPEPNDAGEIIAEAVRLAGVTQQTGRGPTPQTRIAPGLPPLVADRRAAVQMVLNLVSNAVKFTPRDGSVTIEARRSDDGGMAICVADTGIGISDADIPKALAPFSQIDDGRSRQQGGTGLGLPIVKSLIELHGGKLVLESEPGKGTRATLKFPPLREASHAA